MTKDRHALEGFRLALPVEEVQIRNRHLLELRRLLVNAHQLFRLWIRQRLDQHRIDDAKDGRVRANAERQGQQRDDRNHSPFEQHPHRVAQVFR